MKNTVSDTATRPFPSTNANDTGNSPNGILSMSTANVDTPLVKAGAGVTLKYDVEAGFGRRITPFQPFAAISPSVRFDTSLNVTLPPVAVER